MVKYTVNFSSGAGKDLVLVRRFLALPGIISPSTLNTDEAGHYKGLRKRFKGHQTVNHSEKEYARGETTTNTVEGFFSIFKRGMKGTYQHCNERHLQRYLNEFDFRYNNRIALGIDDTERFATALKGSTGKRLTYRRIGERAHV